jgi:hypothetical protein
VHAYGIFFIGCGLIGIPAVILFAALELWHKRSRLVPAGA